MENPIRKKINIFGKAGKIISMIIIICLLVAEGFMLVGTIVLAALPEDAVSVDIRNNTDFKVSSKYMDVEDGQIMLTKYKGSGGIVSIPARMFGAPVTSLRANLFLNREDITEVTVSDGVKFIGQHAFESCTALREITIPPSVEMIASEAFLRCSPKLVIRAAKGSAAALFAEKAGIKVKYIRF